MKKIAISCFPLLFVALLFSCNKEAIDVPAVDDVQLRSGSWMVDHVEVNYFSGSTLTSSDYIPFGEGTEGGICIFKYDTDKWTMDDNGEVFEFSYRIEDRVIYTAGGGTWGVRELNEDRLEMTLRGEETNNPCDFSAAGSVYYLTKVSPSNQ